MRNLPIVIAVALALAGCATGYWFVPAEPTSVVRGAMHVNPSISWNKAPKTAFDIAREETWTQNGPLLDSITFIGALSDGEAIAKQRPKDDRKAPVFRSDMTPQDLVSMVESYYRIKAGATIFETISIKPASFLNASAVEFNYRYVGLDEVKRLGRTLVAVIDGKLYLMSLDGAALHYFDAALPEFERIAASATIS